MFAVFCQCCFKNVASITAGRDIFKRLQQPEKGYAPTREGKCKDVQGAFTFIGWGTVIAGTAIIHGGSGDSFKALPENLASFQLEPEGDCSEFLDALRALVKANSSEEEAALRHL